MTISKLEYSEPQGFGPLAVFSFYSLWYSFLRTEDKICVVIKTNEITSFMM